MNVMIISEINVNACNGTENKSMETHVEIFEEKKKEENSELL